MKMIIFLTLLFFPFSLFAQQQVTLKSGQLFEAYIMGVRGENLVFYQKVNEIDSKIVNILAINSISGDIEKSTKRALIKKNPEIIFESSFIAAPKDNSYQAYNQQMRVNLTAGDHIKRAGTRYATGLGIAIGGCVVMLVGRDSQEAMIAGGAIAITGAIISITGHFELIKAGKKMNSDAVTLGPSTQGIGLAINF